MAPYFTFAAQPKDYQMPLCGCPTQNIVFSCWIINVQLHCSQLIRIFMSHHEMSAPDPIPEPALTETNWGWRSEGKNGWEWSAQIPSLNIDDGVQGAEEMSWRTKKVGRRSGDEPPSKLFLAATTKKQHLQVNIVYEECVMSFLEHITTNEVM